MSPLTILIIRHAEKPDDPSAGPWRGPGLTEAGAENKHSLLVRGWQRAGAWAALFGAGIGGSDYPRPNAVYAADPNKTPTEDHPVSRRPWETIVPLCERLGAPPVTQFGVGDETAMLDAVRQMTGTVLICWEHKKIIEAVLPELAKGQTVPDLPTKWPGSRFDVVLRFDRPDRTAPWTFRPLFPRLLSEDSDAPL